MPLNIPFAEKTVYLVGGGSGALKHLTLEADSILSQAEVILHDMYMEGLQEHYTQSEWIHVGKKKGFHVKKQSEINELLLEYALSGKRTVRLKGGDPAFFARSSEEVEILKGHGFSVKIISGISSPQLLSQALGDSLTHRDKARSLSFWSGYWDKEISAVKIPTTEAHIIFMGLAQIEIIIDKLLEEGKSKETSFIAVSHLGRPNEKMISTTLGEAKFILSKTQLSNPTLFAIGLGHIGL
jgi:siroheme synthase